jgi:hypothetical protein
MKLEELEQRILADSIIPEFRVEDVRGTFEVRLATVKEAIAADYSGVLLSKAVANVDALKPALRAEQEERLKVELGQRGLAGGLTFLTDLIKELQEASKEVEAKAESLPAEIEKKQKALLDDLQAHTRGWRKVKRFERWLPGGASEINALTQKKVANARIPATLSLLNDLRLHAEGLELRLKTLAACIASAVARLATWREQEAQRIRQGVFAEVMGTHQDVAFVFDKLSLNLSTMLPRWFNLVPAGEVEPGALEPVIEQICRDALAAFPKHIDEALASYSYIDNHAEEVQQKVLAAYMTLAVPFVALARQPESELQTFVHTGYKGTVPITQKLREQVPVTESAGLEPSEIVVTRVRIGLQIPEIAGIDHWRAQAEALQSRFPLYATDPKMLDELPLDEEGESTPEEMAAPQKLQQAMHIPEAVGAEIRPDHQ